MLCRRRGTTPLYEQRHLSQQGIRMRMYAKTIGCTAIAVTLTLLGSPLAHADDASFVRDAKALGFQQNSVNLLSSGRSVCYVLRLGNRNPQEITDRIARFLNVSGDLAHQFTVLSVNEWCPQYSNLYGV
jgi:hypothetical protein